MSSTRCECGKLATESGACADCEASCRGALMECSRDDDPNACPHYAEGINYESDDKARCVFCQRPVEETGWLTVRDAYNRERVHVVPLNDSFLHRTVRDECECGPRVEDDHRIFVHASLDGRELKERNV